MRTRLLAVLMLVTCALVLGVTVFREPVAAAAQAILPVYVTNDASHPVPVQVTPQQTVKVADENNAAYDPFQIQLFGEASFTVNCEHYNVPAGKRLVIEYVSGRIINLLNGQDTGHRLMSVQTTASGVVAAPHWMPISEPRIGGESVAAQLVRLYADPGSQIQVCAPGGWQVTLSGYRVAVT